MKRGNRVDKKNGDKRVLLSITGPYKPSKNFVYYQWILLSESLDFKVYGDGHFNSKSEALKDAELKSELLGLYVSRVIGT